jgi:radical SAM protein with 4Fe4S-binding SPASM domain
MGPFSERRHTELAALVDRFSVHVEALSPELYDELMAPLRAAIVFPKIERLMALAPGKVNVAVPLSRRNAGEFAALRTHWMARGARNVCDLKFSNRTTDSLDYYRDSLGPTPNACAEGVRFDLVVDWDGKVLACCQDFLKREPLGDLTQSTVSEVLLTQQRARFVERLKSGHWNALRSCRHCKIDPQGQSHGSDED